MNTDKQLPVIERNFHILNDDRFIMEKISLPVEQQEGEDIHAALNRTRETIVQNFKAAYPKVYTSLNFDEVIQVNNDKELTDFASKISLQAVSNLISKSDEKINKGTIEPQSDESIIEDIKSCNDIKIVESYHFVAKKKPAIKEAVEKRLAELSQKQNSIV